MRRKYLFLSAVWVSLAAFVVVPVTVNGGSTPAGGAPVTLLEDANTFWLANGYLVARIDKRSGNLISLKYQGSEMLAPGHGMDGGYWSSVGSGQAGSRHEAAVLIQPASNGGGRAEVACRLRNDPYAPIAGVDVEYRYALGRGERGIYASALFEHKAGYPALAWVRRAIA